MKLHFSDKWNALLFKFNSQGFLIDFFGKTRTKDTMYFHGSTYNLISFL